MQMVKQSAWCWRFDTVLELSNLDLFLMMVFVNAVEQKYFTSLVFGAKVSSDSCESSGREGERKEVWEKRTRLDK